VHFRETPPTERVIRATIALPAKASVHTFALSPDGRYLILAARVDGTQRLWLRPFEAPDPQPLPGTEEAQYPFWSPDSRYIGFFAQGKLKKIAVTGGPVQNLCDAADGRGGTWNREGVIVFAPSVASGSSLQRVAAGGGVPSPVTRAESGTHRFPTFLPDGHRVLYLAERSKTPEQNGIILASLDSRESRRLLPDMSNALYVPLVGGSHPAQILFVRDGALMAQPVNPGTLQGAGEASPVVDGVGHGPNTSFFRFSISADGSLTVQASPALPVSQLTWFERNGAQSGVVGQPGYMSSFSISPDGKNVALTRYRSSDRVAGSDIWLHEVERSMESRFTLKELHNDMPVWAPDGNSIVFGRGTPPQPYQKRTNGVGQEVLLAKVYGGPGPVSWSRDARFLLLTSGGIGNLDLSVLPLEGDREPVPFVASEFQETQGQFSPDGNWMAYASNESGRFEVYGSLSRTGRARKASRRYPPLEARTPAGGQMAKSCSTSTQAAGCWLFRSRTAIRKWVSPWVRPRRYSTRGSHGRTVGWVIPRPYSAAYDVAPDGKRFLVRTIREPGVEAPLMLVTNWQALLK
jgi:Tol biopolymer transport system component